MVTSERAFARRRVSTHRSSASCPLTERAFDDLCRIVNVPLHFAKDIPTDLAASISNRLARPQQKAVAVVRREESVVGIVDPARWTHSRAKTHRPTFLPVSNRE